MHILESNTRATEKCNQKNKTLVAYKAIKRVVCLNTKKRIAYSPVSTETMVGRAWDSTGQQILMKSKIKAHCQNHRMKSHAFIIVHRNLFASIKEILHNLNSCNVLRVPQRTLVTTPKPLNIGEGEKDTAIKSTKVTSKPCRMKPDCDINCVNDQ